LILTDNQLRELPGELGERPHLQKLALAGNQLSQLPDSMVQCRRLGLLRMSANRFEQIPPWLLDLPNLAWLAVGGNPWGAQRESRVLEQSALPDLDWAALQMGGLLGQGASGVIHAAHWPAGPADGRALAVKVFKGEVTSDGWPHSEWAASLAAGLHPHLISASARLTAHPLGAEGLVMPRIAPEFSTLAGPPSLSSCTRDVYPAATQIDAEVLQRMASGVVDAARHLHHQGISHGDLYAHNLLWNGKGDIWLGDFGAASLLPEQLSRAERQGYERLEVLAFGHLLEEWLSRCPDAPPALQQVQTACVSPEPKERPLFAEVAAALGSKT
jgi:hypothetical protein